MGRAQRSGVARQVGQGEGDPANPLQATRADAADPQQGLEPVGGFGCQRGMLVEAGWREQRVAAHPTGRGPSPGLEHSFGDGCSGLAGSPTDEMTGIGPGHRDPKVESVDQRPGKSPPIPGQGLLTAAAPSGRTTVAARTRVHRRDELEPGGKGRAVAGPGHSDDPLLERLTQRVENIGVKFGDLVEEEHPVGSRRWLIFLYGVPSRWASPRWRAPPIARADTGCR
jgi:hypothetical protein